MMNKGYQKIIDEFSEFVNGKQQSIPYNFNILDEQCGHIVENSHTNLLMKLLGYKNHHGYEFLSKFFDYIGWNLEVDSSKGVKIVTEKSIAGGGRIDGYILQEGNFAIIIENKINGAGNQPEQIQRYVEDIIKERWEDIWVVYLTKDGQKNPDKASVDCMRKYGIISSKSKENEGDDSEIEGQRYAALNYKEHILPWLKDVIQPCVMQKEVVLNTGLIQYIDFLEGFLGIRKSDAELMEEYKNKLKELLKLEVQENASNYEKYYQILNEVKGDLKNEDNPNEERLRIINIIDNIINELYEDPLTQYYEITKKYFTEKLGMENCIFRHPNKSFRYMQILDASWPNQVHFEWFPLAVYLTDRKKRRPNALYFHAEQTYAQNFKHLEENGSRRISQFKIPEINIPILNMKQDELQKFLEEAYSVIPSDFVKKINEKLSKS